VLFREAVFAAPTCSASRACLLTGQYGQSNGMLGLAHRGRSLRDVHYSKPPPNLPDTPEVRADVAAFKASARSLDHGVGNVRASARRPHGAPQVHPPLG
jgi:hypothetical protein